jgi:hypothetical protein
MPSSTIFKNLFRNPATQAAASSPQKNVTAIDTEAVLQDINTGVMSISTPLRFV